MTDKTSWQVRQVWKRFGSWYGADALERKFGLQPPEDWCDVIDAIERNKLEAIMVDVRAKYPTWIPSLPEFEGLVKSASKPVRSEGPTMQERLTDFVLRTKRLSDEQTRAPWKFLYSGNARTGDGFAVTGVEIPPLNGPGYRVMVIDMQAEAA
jgi:hypothetical protein